MKSTKRFPLFYCIYFLCIALFLTALYVSLGVVREYLADYESAQPQYEAQRVFDKYYSAGSYTGLLEICDANYSEFEKADAVISYLNDYTKDKEITYNSISSGLDSDIKYIVKADGVKFSSFTLTTSDITTPKGVPLYTLKEAELYTTGNESVRITAPKGYTVLLNGVPVSDVYRTGNMQPHMSCEHMPEGTEGIVYVEYQVNSLYFPEESVQVLSPNGTIAPLNTTEDGSYKADIVYSTSLKSEYEEYVVAAAKALAAYMQNDGRFAAIASYLDPSSNLYTNVKSSETYFVIDHSSYTFEDVVTSEYYAYDDTTFSCRVSLTHVLKRYGSKDYRDYLDMTFYLRKIGDTYLIYDRFNH